LVPQALVERAKEVIKPREFGEAGDEAM
jgi:hypothetical protein